jgi:hypothetical protein
MASRLEQRNHNVSPVHASHLHVSSINGHSDAAQLRHGQWKCGIEKIIHEAMLANGVAISAFSNTRLQFFLHSTNVHPVTDVTIWSGETWQY